MTEADRLEDAIDGMVHAETQVADHGVDLTLATVYDHEAPGRVDFGGGELDAAGTSPREPSRRNPDDDYGWWHFDPGGYLIEHNERLVDEGPYWLQTRDAVRERGAFHPTLAVDSLDLLPLFVGAGGIQLKENARVSTVRPGPG